MTDDRRTAKEYAIADADTSAAMGLPAQEHGMLFAIDDEGSRWTYITYDVECIRLIREANDRGVDASGQVPTQARGLGKRVGPVMALERGEMKGRNPAASLPRHPYQLMSYGRGGVGS